MRAQLSWPRKPNLSAGSKAFGTIPSMQQERFIFLYKTQLMPKSLDLNKTGSLQPRHDDDARRTSDGVTSGGKALTLFKTLWKYANKHRDCMPVAFLRT